MAEHVRVRVVPDFPGLVIASDGRIQGPSGKWLKTRSDKDGYQYFSGPRKSTSHRQETLFVHVVVCTAFHGPRPSPEYQAAHNNGVNRDNHPGNLRWATVRENHADKVLHGTALLGSRNHKSKLTGDDVQEIRRLRSSGVARREVADRYGVAESTVTRIVQGKIWGHL